MTEYTLSKEASVTSVTGSELVGVTQSGVYKQAAVTDLFAQQGGSSMVLATGPFNLQTTVSTTQSIRIGSTLSSLIGFYGTTGTSAAVTITNATAISISSSTSTVALVLQSVLTILNSYGMLRALS